MQQALTVLLLAVSVVAVAVPVRADELPALKEQAFSGEMSPRRKALKVLVALGTPQAADVMIAAALAAEKRGDTVGVNDVAYSFKGVASPAMAPSMRAAAPTAPKALQRALVTVLGRLADVESVPMLRKFAHQAEDRSLAREARFALAAATQDREDVEEILAGLKDRKTEGDSIESLGRLAAPSLAPSLFPLLRDSQVSQQAVVAAIKALGRMAAPASAVPLLDVVERDERGAVTSEAGRALASVAEPAQLGRLEKLLVEKERREVREAYLAADRRQGWKALIRLLARKPALAGPMLYDVAYAARPSDEPLALAALASSDDTVKRGGIAILAHLDTAGAESALCRELKDARNKSYSRVDAAQGLAGFGTDTSITCLIDAMEGEQNAAEKWRRTYSGNNTWEECVRSLQHITNEKMEENPKEWRTWHQGGLKAGIPGMVAGLSHADAAVRMLAATRIAQHKERRDALDALLVSVAKERNADARVAMLRAIAAIRDPKARDVLVGVLESSGNPAIEERIVLARALDDLGDGRGTGALVALLGSENEKERDMAARALSEVTGEPLHHDAAAWRAWWKAHAERYRR
jgi:HEAT repeat protein